MRVRIAVLFANAVLTLAGCGSSPAQTILSKLPGYSDIQTFGGVSLDDNTISEGNCTFDETTLQIYVWAAGDTSDQHQFVSFGDPCEASLTPGSSQDGCIVGTRPTPWYISVGTDGYWPPVAAALWRKIARALRGRVVSPESPK
jgi:hypothetical protein